MLVLPIYHEFLPEFVLVVDQLHRALHRSSLVSVPDGAWQQSLNRLIGHQKDRVIVLDLCYVEGRTRLPRKLHLDAHLQPHQRKDHTFLICALVHLLVK